MLASAKVMHWLINSFRLILNAVALASNTFNTATGIRIEMTSFSFFFGKNFSKTITAFL